MPEVFIEERFPLLRQDESFQHKTCVEKQSFPSLPNIAPISETRTVYLNKRRIAVSVMIPLLVLCSLAFSDLTLGNDHGANVPRFTGIERGHPNQSPISRHWGQYSPYFPVPSEIGPEIPSTCDITFAQVLSRHGARYPTASKSELYNATVAKIQKNAKSFKGDYAFLEKYEYKLGADSLTLFGESEMFDSGTLFYQRYQDLASQQVPFVRASGESRVVRSAEKFNEGFTAEAGRGHKTSPSLPAVSINVVISEADGTNNTLNHGLCSAFENGPDGDTGSNAQAEWMEEFLPPIQARVSKNLPGVNLTMAEVVVLMDLCPFETVATDSASPLSPFCALFSAREWQYYDYYQSLGKYYGYGSGNRLGPTQGVGFTNELIARLTGQPVKDHTSVNQTLDSSASDFPLDAKLYADFSHDNDMTAIFAAMGLYNATSALSTTSFETPKQANGYSAAWTVPFAARAYVEKMQCGHRHGGEELVRVIVNDRVIPLVSCAADEHGRCKLSAFIDSLSFASQGGFWNDC